MSMMAAVLAPQLDLPTLGLQRQPLSLIPGSTLPCSGSIDCSVCNKKVYISCNAQGHVVIVLKTEGGVDAEVGKLIGGCDGFTTYSTESENLWTTGLDNDYFRLDHHKSKVDQTVGKSKAAKTRGRADDSKKILNQKLCRQKEKENLSTVVATVAPNHDRCSTEYDNVEIIPEVRMKTFENSVTGALSHGFNEINVEEMAKLKMSSATTKQASDRFGEEILIDAHSRQTPMAQQVKVKKKRKKSISDSCPALQYHCELCNSNVKDEKVFAIHIRNHLEPKAYECDICGKRFRQLSIVNRHRRRVHDGWRPYACDTCGKTFATRDSLRQHRNIHLGIKPHVCHLCGKSFSVDGNLKRHLLYHSGDKPFSCDFCGKRFFQKIAKVAHQRIHTGECPFCCEFCGKGFKRAQSLKRHLENHEKGGEHTMKKCWFSAQGPQQDLNNTVSQSQYFCEICGKTYASKSGLHNHNRYVHEKIRPYKCNVCLKQFCTDQSLKQHYLIHTGEKPFVCSVCGKKFNTKENCTRHMKLHSGERPYKCEVCGKGFAQKSNMMAHLKTHDKHVQLQLLL